MLVTKHWLLVWWYYGD